MTGKRKTASKAAKPDRVGARSHAQKRGTIKKPVEHDQRRKAAPAEQNGSTLPPNIHDQEKAERARQERLQRAEEIDRRRAAVDRFVGEQRGKHEWIHFAEIADWFARRDNAVVPNEAARSGTYELLRDAALSGDFEEDGKSQVRFMHPKHETGELSRRRTVDRETEKAVSLPDALDTFSFDEVVTHYLAHCWIPRRLFLRWLTKHGLSPPARFDSEEGFAAHGGIAKPDRLSIKTSRSNARRRGRKPEKMERTKEAMRRDISERKLTIDDLNAMPEKQLVEKYGVSRTTARDARNAVLSEIVENPNSGK